MERRFHIAIATNDITATVADYSERLGAEPDLVIPNEYALWRTDALNVSMRQDASCKPGELRHLGWEDSEAESFTADTDVNGIVWERFAAQHQAAEIEEAWPSTNYQAD